MSTLAHRSFSARRVGALTVNTLTELTRLKIFYVVLLFAIVLIGSSTVMARLSFQQEFQVLKDISLGAISIFSSLLAIVATARMLPEDIEHRTVYTILAKPVPRFEYLVGKLLGVLVLLAISVTVMALLFAAVLFIREQSALAETTRQMAGAPHEQLEGALQAIRASSFNPDLFAGIAVIYINACLLASATLFISTFATTSIFTTIVAAFIYFIGHLESTAREFWLQQNGGSSFSRAFLALVALLFPDLEMFNLTDTIVAGVAIPAGVLAKTIAFGGFYTVLYLLLAIAVFNAREL